MFKAIKLLKKNINGNITFHTVAMEIPTAMEQLHGCSSLVFLRVVQLAADGFRGLIHCADQLFCI